MKTIYDLKLHEHMNEGNIFIVRVAGGWIYMYNDFGNVFVPFDNEFMITSPKDYNL